MSGDAFTCSGGEAVQNRGQGDAAAGLAPRPEDPDPLLLQDQGLEARSRGARALDAQLPHLPDLQAGVANPDDPVAGERVAVHRNGVLAVQVDRDRRAGRVDHAVAAEVLEDLDALLVDGLSQIVGLVHVHHGSVRHLRPVHHLRTADHDEGAGRRADAGEVDGVWWTGAAPVPAGGFLTRPMLIPLTGSPGPLEPQRIGHGHQEGQVEPGPGIRRRVEGEPAFSEVEREPGEVVDRDRDAVGAARADAGDHEAVAGRGQLGAAEDVVGRIPHTSRRGWWTGSTRSPRSTRPTSSSLVRNPEPEVIRGARAEPRRVDEALLGSGRLRHGFAFDRLHRIPLGSTHGRVTQIVGHGGPGQAVVADRGPGELDPVARGPGDGEVRHRRRRRRVRILVLEDLAGIALGAEHVHDGHPVGKPEVGAAEGGEAVGDRNRRQASPLRGEGVIAGLHHQPVPGARLEGDRDIGLVLVEGDLPLTEEERLAGVVGHDNLVEQGSGDATGIAEDPQDEARHQRVSRGVGEVATPPADPAHGDRAGARQDEVVGDLCLKPEGQDLLRGHDRAGRIRRFRPDPPLSQSLPGHRLRRTSGVCHGCREQSRRTGGNAEERAEAGERDRRPRSGQPPPHDKSGGQSAFPGPDDHGKKHSNRRHRHPDHVRPPVDLCSTRLWISRGAGRPF